MSPNPIPDLLSRIRRHCEARKISPATFGRKAVNDGKLVKRLEEGKTITLDTLKRIEAELGPPPTEKAA